MSQVAGPVRLNDEERKALHAISFSGHVGMAIRHKGVVRDLPVRMLRRKQGRDLHAQSEFVRIPLCRQRT